MLANLRRCLLLVCLPLSFALGQESPPGAKVAAERRIQVRPASLRLHHHRQPHSLLVTVVDEAGFTHDLGKWTTFQSEDEKIAKVSPDGWVTPVANGSTQIVITIAGHPIPAVDGVANPDQLRVPVQVQLPEQELPASFLHEVMPALSKAGCNSGACHGYSLGKNGFKLSLRGADADPDFAAITTESFGRRLDRQHPEQSLLLAKPLGDVPHQGGVRFNRQSLSHELLLRWISQGAPSDLADKTELIHVRLAPEKLVLADGQRHQLQLIAEYSDGSTRDVTRLGIFNANNEQFATVSDSGLVTAGENGETAIVARFERRFAATAVLVLRPDPGFQPTPLPESNFIDRLVIQKLNDLKIKPSPLASDEEFLRRIHLDLIGLQPKPDEVRAFLADNDPHKRDKTIEALFTRPEFVDHWSLKWGDLFQNSRNAVSSPSVFLFREWIRSAVAANLPADAFVRGVLTSRGGPQDDPAGVFYAISKDTNDTVERATQVFCGVRMLCARCHPHPMENWTQADYFGLVSFFNQVSTRPDPRFPGVANSKVVQLNLAAASAVNPRTNRPQPARYLGGGEPNLPAGSDRRVEYARWLTAPENPHFARSLANRVWSYFFHRGIVDPVDDLRSTNPPINPQLLEALTQDFVDHQFDLRHLMRRIVTSHTYQRSSLPETSNQRDEQNFSHAIPRRIPAEALLDCLVQATGVRENLGGAPAGFSAAQLPDGNVQSEFLSLFGKPQRMEACECERDNNSNMLQALHFINGTAILGRAANPNGRLAALLKQQTSDEPLVEEMYLWCLARRPSEKELALAVEFLKSQAQRAEAAQDLMWALLNSKDFMLVN